jgi:hypothetical protein
MVDRSPWLAMELTGAQPSGRSGARWLAARRGKEGGHHRDSIFPSTEAWEAARRWRTCIGASAQKGNDAGMVGSKRKVGGVGIFDGAE